MSLLFQINLEDLLVSCYLCTLSLSRFPRNGPYSVALCKLFVGKSWLICAEPVSCLVPPDRDEEGIATAASRGPCAWPGLYTVPSLGIQSYPSHTSSFQLLLHLATNFLGVFSLLAQSLTGS